MKSLRDGVVNGFADVNNYLSDVRENIGRIKKSLSKAEHIMDFKDDIIID